MHFELPPLPYELNALEPHISRETLEYHYGKHHRGYVAKLNALTENTHWKDQSLEEIMKKAEGGVYNNAAQIWNHTFYWKSMSGEGGGQPVGMIKQKIEQSFGTFEDFKKQFSESAVGHFGSGWAWVVLKNDGKLGILSTHDAGNPIAEGTGRPVLTCDVWEHAYYIDYRNDRTTYLGNWWSLVNWEFANINLSFA